MRYVSGKDDAGNPIEIRDPLADKLGHVVAETSDSAERVSAFLNIRSIFGEDLPANHDVFNTIAQAYLKLRDHGAKNTVAALVQDFT